MALAALATARPAFAQTELDSLEVPFEVRVRERTFVNGEGESVFAVEPDLEWERVPGVGVVSRRVTVVR